MKKQGTGPYRKLLRRLENTKLIDDGLIQKWEQRIQGSIPIEDWQAAFTLLNKIWINPTFRNTQFKVLNRIIGVGEYSAWVTGEPNHCTFCKLEGRDNTPESPEHAFYFCPTTAKILQGIVDWEPFKLMDLQNKPYNFLVWSPGETIEHKYTLNAALIWIKHYLFIKIKQKKLPTLKGLQNYIQYNSQEIDWTLKSRGKNSDYSIFWNWSSFIKMDKGYIKNHTAVNTHFPLDCLRDPLFLNSQSLQN